MPATVQMDAILDNDAAVKAASELDTSIDQIGKSASSASGVASKAFQGYEKAAQGAGAAATKTASETGQLLVKQQQLTSESARLTQGIDLLERAMRRAPEQAHIFSERMQELLLQKRAVADESKTLVKALEGTSAATDKSTQSDTKSAEATGLLTKLFTEKTNAVRTSGTIFEGYDHLLQAGIGSFGGISIAATIFLAIIGSLGEAFLKSGKEIQAVTILSKDLLESDIQLAAIFERMAAAAGNSNVVLNAQVVTFREIVKTDLHSALLTLSGSYSKMVPSIEAANAADSKRLALLLDLKIKQVEHSEALERDDQKLFVFAAQVQRATNALHSQDETFQKLQKTRQDDTTTVNQAVEALVIFARATGTSTEEMLKHARSIRADEGAIAQLSVALDGATQAQMRFMQQRANFKLPDFDFAGTSIGQIDAQQKFADAMKGGSVQLDDWYKKAGLANDEARKSRDLLIGMTPVVKSMNDELTRSVERQAAERGQYLNKKQVLSEVRQELGKMAMSADEVTRQEGKMRLQILNSDEALKKHADGHRGAAAAARAYSNTLVDLIKRANEAEIALRGNTFGAQEAKIREETQAARQHLEINKRDRAAAIAEIDRLERAQIEGIAQKRQESERNVLDTIRQLRIAAIQDERTRRLEEIEFQVDKFAEARRKEFDDSTLIFVMTDIYRRRLFTGFNQWEGQENAKHWIAQRQARLDEEKKFYDEQRKLAIARGRDARAEEQGKFAGVGRKLGIDIFNADEGQLRIVEDYVKRMDRLHVTMRLLDGDFIKDQRDAQRFNNTLKLIEASAKHDTFAAMRTGLQSVAQDFFTLANMAQIFGDSLASALEQSIASGKNFALVFGTEIVASVLQQFGAMLMAHGISDILLGVAINSNPFTPGMGTALIHAGIAEVAEGAIMQGVGGAIRGLVAGSGSGNAANSGAASSGTSPVSAGGSASSSGAGRQPISVLFPTSPSSDVRPSDSSQRRPPISKIGWQGDRRNQPQDIHIHLSDAETRRWWDDQMEKKGMVSISSARRRHKQPLKEALRD